MASAQGNVSAQHTPEDEHVIPPHSSAKKSFSFQRGNTCTNMSKHERIPEGELLSSSPPTMFGKPNQHLKQAVGRTGSPGPKKMCTILLDRSTTKVLQSSPGSKEFWGKSGDGILLKDLVEE